MGMGIADRNRFKKPPVASPAAWLSRGRRGKTTKVTKLVDFWTKICSDLTKQLFSTCVLSCSSANSFIYIDRRLNNEEMSTKQNVKNSSSCPTMRGKMTYGKVTLPHWGARWRILIEHVILPHSSNYVKQLPSSCPRHLAPAYQDLKSLDL